MQKSARFGALLLAVSLLLSAVPASVGAKPTSGLDIVPIQQPEFWTAEGSDNTRVPLNAPNAGIATSIDEGGVVTLKRTDKAKNNWVNIRSMSVQQRPMINLKENPYVYFDFTCTTQWNISLQLDNESVGMAQPITATNPSVKQLSRPEMDGNAGTYKGKFNLYEYIQKNLSRLPKLKDKTEFQVPQVVIYIVDNTADHLSGELTIRQLSIGNDDANAPDGMVMNAEDIATGDPAVFEDMVASNTTRSPDYVAFADGVTKPQTKQDNTLLFSLIGVAVVVAAGVVLCVVLLRKKPAASAADQTPTDKTE